LRRTHVQVSLLCEAEILRRASRRSASDTMQNPI
jgi:hypothetical protein